MAHKRHFFDTLKQNKMKKLLFLTAVFALILQMSSFAQSIKLNNAGDPGSAMLEVNSASKGILHTQCISYRKHGCYYDSITSSKFIGLQFR